tara:strand:- start:10 stop:795 length:786 start_codon:yes stop_codon:yes gene_type:complete
MKKALICKSDLDNEDRFKLFEKQATGAIDQGIWPPPAAFKSFVDVGVHYGGYLYAGRYRGASEVYGFEASWSNCCIAEEMIQKCSLSNVRVFNLAASSKSGEIVQLTKVKSEDASSWKSGNYSITDSDTLPDNMEKSHEHENVLTIDLENIFKLCELDTIDVLKVDIEGAEYDFLNNKDLSNINYINIEFHGKPHDTKALCEHMCKTHNLMMGYTSKDDTRLIPVANNRSVPIDRIDFSKDLHFALFQHKSLNQPIEIEIK